MKRISLSPWPRTASERADRRVSASGRLWIALGGTIVAIVLTAVAFDLGSGRPALCASCHEMSASAETWQQSAHSVVACVECHESPTQWYQLAERVGGRIALLSRDVNAHWSEAYAAGMDPSLTETAKPTPDAVCLQCHDPNRKATSGYRILIDHVEHAKRNGSCVSCHVRTAHPQESRGGPLSLMGQCYTCHGSDEYPDADTACGTCHPADYDPLPTSHREVEWSTAHGRTWEVDAKLCTMCHQESFCSDCHGLAMPHPAEWVGEHVAPGEAEPQVCARCHEGGQQLCSSCHHARYAPSDVAWLDEHPAGVRAEGAAACFSCHEPNSCSFCHTRLVEGGGS